MCFARISKGHKIFTYIVQSSDNRGRHNLRYQQRCHEGFVARKYRFTYEMLYEKSRKLLNIMEGFSTN